MNTYLILAASAILTVVIVSLCIAWAEKRAPVDRTEDRAQSDADVRHIVDSVRAPLETTRRVRGLS